jgi:hypothetical protein
LVFLMRKLCSVLPYTRFWLHCKCPTYFAPLKVQMPTVSYACRCQIIIQSGSEVKWCWMEAPYLFQFLSFCLR